MSIYDFMAFLDLAITCMLGSALFNMSSSEFQQGTNKEFRSPLMTELYKKRNPLLNVLVALPIIACFVGLIILAALPLKVIPYNESVFNQYFMVAAIIGILMGRFARKLAWKKWLSRA